MRLSNGYSSADQCCSKINARHTTTLPILSANRPHLTAVPTGALHHSVNSTSSGLEPSGQPAAFAGKKRPRDFEFSARSVSRVPRSSVRTVSQDPEMASPLQTTLIGLIELLRPFLVCYLATLADVIFINCYRSTPRVEINFVTSLHKPHTS